MDFGWSLIRYGFYMANYALRPAQSTSGHITNEYCICLNLNATVCMTCAYFLRETPSSDWERVVTGF